MLSNEISGRKNLLGLGHLGLFGAVLASDGKRLEDQSLDTLDTLWRAAKKTTSAS